MSDHFFLVFVAEDLVADVVLVVFRAFNFLGVFSGVFRVACKIQKFLIQKEHQYIQTKIS